MPTTPSQFEKKSIPSLEREGMLGVDQFTAGHQLIFEEVGGSRAQPTFLELERSRGTKIIEMNQAGYVVAVPGEKQRIGTFGLGGCTAVGVVATFPDGHRRAHVQHYDPFAKRMDANVKTSLEEVVLAKEAVEGEYSEALRVDAVIMATSTDHVNPDDTSHATWLTDTLRHDFGEGTNITVVGYSPNLQSGESAYTKTLVIDIPAEGAPEIFPGLQRIQTG
jgi:hypothetical protein